MKRRKIDPETKMVAVIEGLRGEIHVGYLPPIPDKRKSVLAPAGPVLGERQPGLEFPEQFGSPGCLKVRIYELERIIGKQTVQSGIFKQFLVRPEEVSLTGWLKDSGYPDEFWGPPGPRKTQETILLPRATPLVVNTLAPSGGENRFSPDAGYTAPSAPGAPLDQEKIGGLSCPEISESRRVGRLQGIAILYPGFPWARGHFHYFSLPSKPGHKKIKVLPTWNRDR